MKTKTKITDVAKHAGVSISTVSHVINKTRFVSDQTRLKVEKAIRELNYAPDMAAQSLKSGKRRMIGFLAPDLSNRFFSLLLEEIEDTLWTSGYSLVVANTRENYERELNGLQLLTSGITDGIIMASTFRYYKDFAACIPQDFPVVQIDRFPLGCTGDCVRVSTYSAIHDSIMDLIREGHRRIGYIASIERLSSTEERLNGYRNALEQAGIALDPALIKQGDARSRSGYECMKELVEEQVKAVFISNSVMAVGAISYLDNRGLKVGKDMEIISIRDYEWHRFELENVRTVEQPGREMARLAAQQIIRRIEDPQAAPSEIILPATYSKRYEHD